MTITVPISSLLAGGDGTRSSALAWKIPWTEEPGKAVVHGVAEGRTGGSVAFCETSIQNFTIYLCTCVIHLRAWSGDVSPYKSLM